MSRELLVMRHAKSDWDNAAKRDFDRPLAKRGKRDAPRVAAWMFREGLVPDKILSSPAQRARETVIKICKGLAISKRLIDWEPGIYEAGAETLLGLLEDCSPDIQTLLLVGHNPGLEDLLRYLTDNDFDPPKDGKLLPTAAIARLEMPADWSGLMRGCATLVSLTRPKHLPPD